MVNRILNVPKNSFFLFGPRGSGKTTWLKTEFNNAYWIDLLDESRYQSYLVDPSIFQKELLAQADGTWVVVDEFQRLPHLLNEVHRGIENKKLKFSLTGSSARKLKRAGVNLLGGRARRLTMFPFVPQELGSDFALDKVLQWGSLPIVWTADDPLQKLRDYITLYIKEEIQAEAIVRNLPAFSRFLPVSALFHGQVLNISALARDAEVKRNTVEGYIEVLEDTLLADRLWPFHAKLKVREVKHPKLYWIDPGVVRTLKKLTSEPSQEEKGVLLEGYVYMLLRLQRDYYQSINEINYWAPAEAKLTEVDFLLSYGREKIAIEVKASKKLKPEFLKGLKAIRELKGVNRRIVVYLGDRRLRSEDGIEVLPFMDFVEELAKRKI